ncbi:MAG: sugar phosphate isomerase/epimerase [Clostridia bacterium]|nr:sugar phosphate isomerase/epimerase [Clostridia bacterium]
MKAGLNLFSLKSHVQEEADLIATCQRLKEMGYSYFQYSGAAFDAARCKRVVEETGLPIVLTHVPFDRIVGDTEALMEEHALFGCKNIGLGMLPYNVATEWDKCLGALEQMEAAAEKMAKAGFSFFYHNHHLEFRRVDGRTLLDRMMEYPHINFTLDTYWVQNGGGNILKTVEALAGRIRCVHLKDYNVGINPKKPDETKPQPIFAPVGDGNLDFKAIVPAMQQAGTEYFIVEQDNANYYPDPFGEVKRSIDYLTKEF